ncbi:hypothetical protein V5O48_013456 [Marasmius crinis-equi]|uniref:Uncharacterized protein n=1 Tax=Marasmius crinis-equi TaxID=585013 RepID=A0ABR3F010_9AGAR
MSKFKLFCSLLVLASQTLANVEQFIPKRYIVEVEGTHDVFARDESPVHIHKRMYDHFEARGLGYETHHEYGAPGVFVGMSLTVRDHSDLEKLHSIPGVRAVHPVRRFDGPKPIPASISKRAEYAIYDSQKAPATDILHSITGVDKLHAKGLTGKGIKIGILDTGLDYNHPSLGKGFGPGHKVIGGHDFVGDLPDITPPLKPDSDPMDCNGHGTHVAGIIGANPGTSPYNLTGVAYEAELSSYKVAGCSSSIDEDSTIAGLILADQEGNDVITLSLGGPSGWTYSTWSLVASRIAEKGRIVTVAAGNDGTQGAWYAAGPGSGEDVISVASVDNPRFPIQSVLVSGDASHEPIPYFDIFPLTNNSKPLPVYAFANDTTKFGCQNLTNDVPNLENYVVITRIGACPLDDHLQNLATKGANLILFYGAEHFTSISDAVGNFSASLIPTDAGEWLSKQFFDKRKATLTFPGGGRLINYDQPTGGLVSYFSTYGPTFDLRFKPAVGAHGGQILSTYPLAKGGYQIMPGTSMATPYLAGCAALFLQARGKTAEVAKQARNFFETTAMLLPEQHKENPMLQTVIQQGAGLVDAYAAAYAETYLSPGELLLNDTEHFKGTHNFTIKNIGKKEKKYTIAHFPAGTAVTIQPGTIQPAVGPVPLSDAYASVELSATSFTLGPNESKIVTAKFTPASGPKALPVYSGFIQVEAEGEGDMGKVHVSYMGVSGSLKEQQVIDDTDYIEPGTKFPAVVVGADDDGKPIVLEKPGSFEFVGNETTPQVVLRLAFGSPQVDLDLVDPSLDLKKLPSTIPSIGSLFNQTGIFRNVKSQEANLGFFPIPLHNNFTFANGSFPADGTYKVLFRALRVTGDRNNWNDYDMWLSPSLTFKFNDKVREEFLAASAEGAESHGENVEKPVYQRPWFIAVVSAAGALVVIGVAAGVFLSKRRRQSTIASEAPFVPPMGAYKPLLDETKPHQSYSDTSYRPQPAHEDGRYS